MAKQGDIKKLKTSWTKYDCVKVIEIIGDNVLDVYLNGEEGIDPPVLRSYLGIDSFGDPLPQYWQDIQKYPKQKRLFTLAAGIFTHYKNIEWFADEFSQGNMSGVFYIMDIDKHMTNLRSALVVSGAAQNSYRRKEEVPYDLSILFEEGEVGIFFKQLIHQRLISIGYDQEILEKEFLNVCFELKFEKALSLKKEQFKRWLEGKGITQIKTFDYELNSLSINRKITTIKINQWLDSWNDIDFNLPMRKKPEPFFLLFKIDIRLLKRLSDVHRRKATSKRIDDVSVQRELNEKRSFEIKKFVEGGFPWSTLNDSEKNSPQYANLKMPGILPTAIVANILGPNQKRGYSNINNGDLMTIENIDSDNPIINIPDSLFDLNWDPELKPMEIIDGQHRLMAFDETQEINGKYEVPIVAFYDLDRTWQAYLFYVINIKPKKINTSLGYDLYPLLRTQDWLENSKDGLIVYRETRAQELTEALWIYEQSPWYNRINMLGSGEGNNISQAAFIRAFTTTYLRKTRRNISGLFADVLPGKNFEEIRWVRAQQAAFLILLWEQISISVSDSKNNWAEKLKEEKKQLLLFDSNNKKSTNIYINDAFLSKNSMLSRDQGVTGVSMFSNDFFFVAANYFNDYDFNSIEWKEDIDERQIETASIDIAINQFRNAPLYYLIKEFSIELANFDWRTSNAEFDDGDLNQEIQKKYRGSGGYKEIWYGLLEIFKQSNNVQVKKYALGIENLL